MSTSANRVTVHGDVQGVFFRDSTRQQAEASGVSGWVRNDPEGTVSAHLEGDSHDVSRVIEWMRDGGPSQASVDEVIVDDVDAEGHDGFQVR